MYKADSFKLVSIFGAIGLLAAGVFSYVLSAFAQNPSVHFKFDPSKCIWHFNESAYYASAQTNTELVAAPGAGLRLMITNYETSVGGTAGRIKLVEDTGGTPVDIHEWAYFAANGGSNIARNLSPIPVTANTNAGVTSETVTSHSVTLAGCVYPNE